MIAGNGEQHHPKQHLLRPISAASQSKNELRDQKVGEPAFQGAGDFNDMILTDEDMCVECGVDEVAILESSIPKSPTDEERAKHELTHLPFKNWCEICVKTKANTPPHFKRNPSEEGRIPRLSMDYMFMPIGDNSEMAAIIVLKDSESKQLWSRMVDKKGSQADGVIKWIAEIIKDLGYHKIKFRSDQEASIKDVHQVRSVSIEN